MKIIPQNIVISRTDSIGDVILTLPLAGILKAHFPTCKIYFLGTSYTKPILDCCPYIDHIWCWNELSELPKNELDDFLNAQDIDTFIHVFPKKEIAKWAKRNQISNRIGTSHRVFHWTTCNERVDFTRKKSNLHEAQLNTKLLNPLIGDIAYTLEQLFKFIQFSPQKPTKSAVFDLLETPKRKIILHAKSQGSAIEWGVKNFVELSKELDPDTFEIFFTGTEKEGLLFKNEIPLQNNIHDLTGKMSLSELITFIGQSDALVAASTGPLHIAGIQNITTIGLFAPQKPIHPGRWQPLGEQVRILVSEKFGEPSQPLDIDLRLVIRELNYKPL